MSASTERVCLRQAMWLAVRGMLPRNKLRDRIMKQRLRLYDEEAPPELMELPPMPLSSRARTK